MNIYHEHEVTSVRVAPDSPYTHLTMVPTVLSRKRKPPYPVEKNNLEQTAIHIVYELKAHTQRHNPCLFNMIF